ncbi:MAG TPA: hypothetical protein VHY91_13355 [Pirellulales bacterium]|nr:hypothetical protein [Pirellulales bacterium]
MDAQATFVVVRKSGSIFHLSRIAPTQRLVHDAAASPVDRAASLAWRMLTVVCAAGACCALGANQRTPNFIVSAPTPQIAQQISQAAEQYRKQLAIDWLGREMPTWSEPCPITVQVGDHLGAGGATSFLFERGEVYGWRMTIQGSLERILDSVLPHEVTHTVFATHFRRPLPRWADEGACTTVEHVSERAKQQMMLVDQLRTGRGIAFGQMFVMKEYPHDVMPLYSQGYSVARFLIANGGKQKFLLFLADGLRDENWSRAVQAGYGYADLAALQGIWLDWVRQGSPALDRAPTGQGDALASAASRSRPSANLIYRGASPPPDFEPVSAPPEARPAVAQARQLGPTQLGDVAGAARQASASAATGGKPAASSLGWHAPGVRPTTAPAADELAQADSPAAALDPATIGNDANHQVTRPQPTEQVRQTILEWSRSNTAPGAQPAANSQGAATAPPAARTAVPGGTASVYNQTATR